MKRKILFVFPNISSFVSKDIKILQEKYEVDIFEFHPKKKWLTPIEFFRQSIFLILKINKYDILICQLAAYHSFLPALFSKLFNRPCLIILGGTDCARFPSISYGNFTKKILGLFTEWSVRLASHLAPKHQSLISFHYTYGQNDFEYQGIKHFVKDLITPYTVIENGYEPDKFIIQGEKRRRTFLTVASGIEIPNTVKLKGIDLINEIAPEFPDCKFTIVGVPQEFDGIAFSPNILCLPPQDNEKLVQIYNDHLFYMQLSMSEGFPNALCEAMLCGCIPIGSNVNAIPDIIGTTGYLLDKRSKKQLVTLVEKALHEKNSNKSQLARKRIIDFFSLEKRRHKLFELLKNLQP